MSITTLQDSVVSKVSLRCRCRSSGESALPKTMLISTSSTTLLSVYAAPLSGHGLPSGKEAFVHFGTFSSGYVHGPTFPWTSVIRNRAFNYYYLHSTGLIRYLSVSNNCTT